MLKVFLALTCIGGMAYADEVTQVTTPQGDVTTTVTSPAGTTTINNSPGKSVVTMDKSGHKIEMDSDGSVYTVYPDGSRVAAPNGINTLMDGETITVKDGKRIP